MSEDVLWSFLYRFFSFAGNGKETLVETEKRHGNGKETSRKRKTKQSKQMIKKRFGNRKETVRLLLETKTPHTLPNHVKKCTVVVTGSTVFTKVVLGFRRKPSALPVPSLLPAFSSLLFPSSEI